MNSLPSSVLDRVRYFQDFRSDRNCRAVCTLWREAFSTKSFPGKVTLSEMVWFPSDIPLISILTKTIRNVHIDPASEDLFRSLPDVGEASEHALQVSPNAFYVHQTLGSLSNLKALTVEHIVIGNVAFSERFEKGFTILDILKMLTKSEETLQSLHFVTNNWDVDYEVLLQGIQLPKLCSLTLGVERIQQAKNLRCFLPRLKFVAPGLQILSVHAVPRTEWSCFYYPGLFQDVAQVHKFYEEFDLGSVPSEEDAKQAYSGKVKELCKEIEAQFNQGASTE